METHSKKIYHQEAVQAAKYFLLSYYNLSKVVVNQTNKQRLAQINENGERLKPIINSIIFLGRQNIAFGGDRDDGQIEDLEPSPTNEGNSREILPFHVQAGDKILEELHKTASSRATYIS